MSWKGTCCALSDSDLLSSSASENIASKSLQKRALMTETVRPEPSRLYRWVVLIFISVAMGGNYYIYDSINPLERIFIEHLGFSGTRFGWLNSSYSVAAVLTLLIGGIIIDRIGTKKAIFMFAVLCFL